MVAPTVVFDLDGTLVDTAPDLVATLNTIFAREGLPPVAYDAARNMVGGGARAMIERGLAAEGRTLDAAEVDRLVRRLHRPLRRAHRRQLAALSRGRDRARRRSPRGGCRLAVCTNKLEWLSLRLLDALGLSKRFAAICGADTFGVAETRSGTVAAHDRARRRRRRRGRHGRRLHDRHRHRARRRQFRSSRSISAIPKPRSRELGPDRVISRFRDLPNAVFDLLRRRQPTRRGTA